MLDLNADFNASEYGGLFLNSTFRNKSSIPLNVPAPISPINALWGLLRYDFLDAVAFPAAVYDGAPGDFDSDPYKLGHAMISF